MKITKSIAINKIEDLIQHNILKHNDLMVVSCSTVEQYDDRQRKLRTLMDKVAGMRDALQTINTITD